jgi:tRNA threonylcarbamoyladenosine biosynthesis protein TsaB
MRYFLSIQNNYQLVEVALFRDMQSIASTEISKLEASSHLMLAIQGLLNEHQLSFKDLSFIAANQGPGPFTTLRVVIATVNGISFATKLPLIGVDGLDMFLNEYRDTSHPITVALFNAFNRDAYFGIDTFSSREKGCKNIELLLQDLAQTHAQEQIRFIGSGAGFFKDQILSTFDKRAHFPLPMPEQCSLQTIGLHALDCWNSHKNLTYQLLPLYLKGQVVKSSS